MTNAPKTIAAQVPLTKTQREAIRGANHTGLLFCREATGWALVRRGYATVVQKDGLPPMFYLNDAGLQGAL